MKVTFARPWVDADGKEHKPRSTAVVDDVIGRQLIYDGTARPADAEPAKEK